MEVELSHEQFKKTIIVHECFTKYSSIMDLLYCNFKIKGLLFYLIYLIFSFKRLNINILIKKVSKSIMENVIIFPVDKFAILFLSINMRSDYFAIKKRLNIIHLI